MDKDKAIKDIAIAVLGDEISLADGMALVNRLDTPNLDYKYYQRLMEIIHAPFEHL